MTWVRIHLRNDEVLMWFQKKLLRMSASVEIQGGKTHFLERLAAFKQVAHGHSFAQLQRCFEKLGGSLVLGTVWKKNNNLLP